MALLLRFVEDDEGLEWLFAAVPRNLGVMQEPLAPRGAFEESVVQCIATQ